MTPLDFMRLFDQFRQPSWDGWRGVLSRVTVAIRELFIAAGRGAGKSMIIALLVVCFSSRTYRRAPGESIYCGVCAPDKKQARVTFRYIVGLLRSVPSLAALIVRETADSIELSNGVVIEVITATTVAPRGRAYALFVIEEAAFLESDEASANPDVEVVRAVRPALARVPGSLLAVVGSPYARRGVLYEAVVAGTTEDRLVVVADTATLNPSFDGREIARAWRDDPVAAASEYGRNGLIEFRSDVAGLLTDEALAAVVPLGVRELAPDQSGRRLVVAAFDAATGSGEDAAGLGIAFAATLQRPVELAAVRRWPPPFSPETVGREVATLAKSYGVRTIRIDRYAPGLVAALFREHGLSCAVADADTSQHFIELLGLVNSGRVRLLDDPALLGELRRLERRAGGGGREHVGHPPRGHDDLAAAAASALVGAAPGSRKVITSATWGDGSRTPAAAPAYPLDKTLWHHVGVRMGTHHGPTHTRGDQHAERIVSGEIPFAQAKAEQEATNRMNNLMWLGGGRRGHGR